MQRTEVRTGAEGRFEFKGLPAGEYAVIARPAEFRATHLAQTYGDEKPVNLGRFVMGGSFPIKLADGSVREDVVIALRRTLAIEGRVVDESGEPMAGVQVNVHIAGSGQSPPMFGPYQFNSDDRGAFRIYGLAPGRYTICATPRTSVSSASGDTNPDQPVRTCYPSAVIDADAQEVALEADLGAIEIRVQRSRTFSVSGVALDSTGGPLQRGQVNITRIERSGTSGTGVELKPNGEFLARGLVPGDYALQAVIRAEGNPDDEREREMGYVLFRLERSNVDGLVVATRKGARVRGRIVLEDAAGPSPGSSLRVMGLPDRRSRGLSMGPPPSATVAADRSFELTGLFTPISVTVSGYSRDWIVKSMKYRGEDVTGMVIDFTGARPEDVLEIVLSARGARVGGRVTNEAGDVAADAIVYLVPVDPARRSSASGRRFIPVKPDGGFQMGPVAPGEYLIAAIAADDAPMPDDLEAIERIVRVAQRITLIEDDRQTLDLRVRPLR